MIKIRSSSKSDSTADAKLGDSWKNVLARTEVGFTRVCEDSDGWKAIDQLAQKSRPAKKILVLGIGGSSLGTQVISQSLQTGMELHFLESPDPDVWNKFGDLKSS